MFTVILHRAVYHVEVFILRSFFFVNLTAGLTDGIPVVLVHLGDDAAVLLEHLLGGIEIHPQVAGQLLGGTDLSRHLDGVLVLLGGVMAGRAAEKLGINITTVAASELYESLQRGVIDGGEFSTPCSDDSLKLQEVAKYWCSPAWYQSGGVNGVMINKDA